MIDHSDVKEIKEDLNEIKTQLAVYNEQLKIHIKRTEIIEQDLVPIKSHVTLMNNIAKIIIFLGLLAGIYRSVR